MATREELQARVAAAKARAAAAKPTEDEQLEADVIEAEREALEEEAAHLATKRMLAAAPREQAAAAESTGYPVQAVDLVALFPLGKAPIDKMPTGGVIIVRSPPPEASDALAMGVEAKKRPLHSLMLDVLVASTVDPKPDTAEHLKLQLWGKAYPEATTQAAGIARKLGGAKLAEEKRGRG